MKEKVKLSSKIWPIYYGLSDDLMFWAAINTLFLTRVKHLDAGQINLIMSLSVIVCFFGYFLINKIIGKIGALKSIKIGNILLLVASLLFTFLKSFYSVFDKRREWDSNPRALADKRFSRPPRYDHFDISPY